MCIWKATPLLARHLQRDTCGILCNILVCAAVLMAICAKDIIGKLLVSFFVIMLFVTAGF
ncbi:MAG: formate/nitrite transporter family protein [Lachnospiraceae bacterium]